MDISNLTLQEVNQLIKSNKELIKEFPNQISLIGKIKDDTDVLGNFDGVEYKLHRYRHPLETDRYSIHLRFSNTNECLIRVDVNNGSHRNPDGTIVPPNHVHIYSTVKNCRRDAYAFPLPTEFTDLHSIITALNTFLVYNNIKEYSRRWHKWFQQMN